MKKSTRKKLFWTMLVIFLCISIVIVLYAQGYRYDFQANSFQKTGGIFLKISPPNSSVILNHKKSYTASSLSLPLLSTSSLFVNNLLPKSYSVDISKDGYRSLQLQLRVEEQKVIALNRIILIKKDLSLENVLQNVKNPLNDSAFNKIAYFSPAQNKTKPVSLSSLAIFDLKNNSGLNLDLSPNLPKNSSLVNIIPFLWSKDGKILLLSVDTNLKKYWFVCQEGGGSVFDITNQLQNFETKKILNFTFDNAGGIIYFQYKNNLFSLILEKKSVNKLISGIKTFSLDGNYLYFIDLKNQFTQSDLDGQNKNAMALINFDLKNPELIVNSQKSLVGILDKNYNFYIWQEDQKSFKDIAPFAQDVIPSFDGSLIAIPSNEYIYAYVNKDLDEQPFWKKGFVWAIKNFGGVAPQNLIWFYDNFHLITQWQDNLFLSSIDERGGKQIENILENSAVEKIFSPEKSVNVYILIKNQIFKINLI